MLTCVESPKAQLQQGAAPDLGSARRPRGKPAKVAAASTAQYRGLKDPPPSSADTPAPPPRAGPGRLSPRPRPPRPGAPQPWFTCDKGAALMLYAILVEPERVGQAFNLVDVLTPEFGMQSTSYSLLPS